jgi:hypothetical protein
MTPRLTAGLLICHVVLPASAHALTPAGPPMTTVVPNALSTVEGSNNNGFPFWPFGANPPSMRYQQVFASSEFSALRPAGGLITHIAFRADSEAQPFSFTAPSVQVNLSTTSAAPDGMSTTFADNVGGDDAVVFGPAPLALRSSSGATAGPKPFNIVIALTTPFYYNPAAGNLLFDVRSRGGNTDISLDAQLTVGDAVGRQYSDITVGNLDSATASTLSPSLGLVAQFTSIAVPEPATSLLAIAGLLGLHRRPRLAPRVRSDCLKSQGATMSFHGD